jgi:acetyl-CoA decarbonylase/synthase complex subunit gamma
LIDRVKRVEGFGFDYIGQVLRLDLVAVRCTSNNAERFRWAVETVHRSCGLPLVLCSLDAKVLEAGLSVVPGEKPLLCAANVDNWKEMGTLALKNDCGLAVSGAGDLVVLRGLIDSLLKMGIMDLVLDVGTSASDGLGETLDRFVVLRRLACDVGDESSGFPLLGVPMNVWLDKNSSGVSDDILRWREAYVADMLLTRSADLLLLHSAEGWSLLPLVVLRQNLYIDPRKPVAVAPGLREFGCVGVDVPVLLTTNFALTYFTVASDLEKAGVSAYLLVVDTGGIAVDSSVAGRRLTAEKVANALKVSGVEGKVRHKKLVIPGKASRLTGDIERLSGWEVVVGPKDSSDIGKFLQEKWCI